MIVILFIYSLVCVQYGNAYVSLKGTEWDEKSELPAEIRGFTILLMHDKCPQTDLCGIRVKLNN